MWRTKQTTHSSIMYRTHFYSNNLKYLFCIWHHPYPCGGILAHFSLQFSTFLWSMWDSFLHHSITTWLKSGLWLGDCKVFLFSFFSHFVVDLLQSFGSLSCCMAQFWPSSCCQTDGLIFNGWKVSRSYGCKRNSNHHSSTTVLTVDIRCYVTT